MQSELAMQRSASLMVAHRGEALGAAGAVIHVELRSLARFRPCELRQQSRL